MFDDAPAFDANATKGDNARPRFYTEAVQNNFRSQQEGRPIFDEKEFVEILVPGDRKTAWVGQVTDEHRRRWPQLYQAWKAGQEAPEEGYALEQWAGINKAQVEELRFAKVRTVEQLASLPDDALNRCVPMGGWQLREKAQRFLKQMEGSAQTEALAAENASLRETMDLMKAQHEDLIRRLAEMEARANKDAAQ